MSGIAQPVTLLLLLQEEGGLRPAWREPWAQGWEESENEKEQERNATDEVVRSLSCASDARLRMREGTRLNFRHHGGWIPGP